MSKTNKQISEKLLPMPSMEKKHEDAVELKREKLRVRQQTKLFMEQHQFSK